MSHGSRNKLLYIVRLRHLVDRVGTVTNVLKINLTWEDFVKSRSSIYFLLLPLLCAAECEADSGGARRSENSSFQWVCGGNRRQGLWPAGRQTLDTAYSCRQGTAVIHVTVKPKLLLHYEVFMAPWLETVICDKAIKDLKDMQTCKHNTWSPGHSGQLSAFTTVSTFSSRLCKIFWNLSAWIWPHCAIRALLKSGTKCCPTRSHCSSLSQRWWIEVRALVQAFAN